MHESFYLAHWPHEFFSHPEVIPWQRGPKVSSFFEDIWDTRRNSSRHDVNIDYFPGNIPEATDTTKKIWINSASNIQRDFHTEALFEQGIAHMIGGGVRQDIDRGLSLVLAAAEKGCSKAKATVMRLFRVYGKFLEKNDAEIRTWLLDGVRHGSEVALMDLRTKYPDSAECRQADQALRTSFNLQWPGSLDYNRDVHPHFNLLDIAQLRKQMSHEKGKEALHTLFLSPSSCARSPNGKKRAYLYGTLLHIASLLGLSDAVQFLIEAGLDINRENSSRRLTTPLHCAL